VSDDLIDNYVSMTKILESLIRAGRALGRSRERVLGCVDAVIGFAGIGNLDHPVARQLYSYFDLLWGEDE